MKLYLVEYTVGSVIRNMIVQAKDYNAAEIQVKVSAIAKSTKIIIRSCYE